MNDRLNEDLKNAMKDSDKFKLSVLRMLKSALQMESINKKHELSDDEIISVIKKQTKVRKDSLKEYESYNALDKVEDLQKEIDILSVYLPEETSIDEIKKVVEEVFIELKPTSMKDMGSVMKTLGSKLPNADMSVVSQLVREKLN